ELLGGEVPATEPASHYRTELLHNLALPLTAPLMVLLAMPATYGSSRHGGAARGFLLSFALGLGYLVSDKLFIAMGQAGLLPALLAAWGATVMFASIGIAVLLKFEEP
ncbi:MAG TPA: LptF/LptG family permease, partial [Alphaproteobacteria bacterium]|nr:LptF/LptG family permease [Alphaproteobacteria bacterium]